MTDPEHSRRSREGALKRVEAEGGAAVSAAARRAVQRIRRAAVQLDPDGQMTPRDRFRAARLVISIADRAAQRDQLAEAAMAIDAELAAAQAEYEALTRALVAA